MERVSESASTLRRVFAIRETRTPLLLSGVTLSDASSRAVALKRPRRVDSHGCSHNYSGCTILSFFEPRVRSVTVSHTSSVRRRYAATAAQAFRPKLL